MYIAVYCCVDYCNISYVSRPSSRSRNVFKTRNVFKHGFAVPIHLTAAAYIESDKF